MDWLSLLVAPFVSLWSWLTYKSRVAHRASKDAAQHGLQIHWRALRHHLRRWKFFRDLDVQSARPTLRESLDVFTDGTSVSSAELFDWIERAITLRANPARAATTVGAAVQERIGAMQESVEAMERDRALWEVRLGELRPIRAETARAIHATWPRITSVLRLLDTEDRAGRLDAWSRNLPQFLLDAPADLVCWLADLASDADARPAARAFLKRALEVGPFPLGFWEIRLRWLESDVEGGGSRLLMDREHGLVRAWELEEAGNGEAAKAALQAWEPRIASEAATRMLLLARIAFNENDFDRAIELALPLWEETGSGPGVLIAARAMVARQVFASSDLFSSGTADAFALLIAARDSLRRWGVDTTDVVVFASTVARLLNDPVRALTLTKASPVGEATSAEAKNLKVRAAAAIMLADNGQLDEGRALLSEPELSTSVSSHLRALIAETDGDHVGASRYFAEALEATNDYEEKGRFAFNLARLGIVHPFVSDQRARGNEKFADHLTLIAGAYGNDEGGIERLQAAAHTSANLSLVLSDLYESRNELDKQLRTLEAAADRLDDADIWLAAARLQTRQGQSDVAIQSVRSALRAAPTAWGAFPRAHGLLVELYSAMSDWDHAVKSAENLVRLLPQDSTAVWTLITCQYYAGEFDDALRTWDAMAGRQRPNDRQHVVVWLGLFQQFGESIGSVEDLVEVADAWASDEDIRRLIVGLLLLPGRASDERASVEESNENPEEDPLRAADREARATLFDDYFRDFPDGAIRRITVDLDDENSIIDRIAEAAGERPDTTELDEQVFAGQFPLGVISYAHSGSLAEAVISHASGVRYASTNGSDEQEIATLALGSRVVADATALFALAVLPEALRVTLMGAFSAVAVSSDQFRDAVAGRQSVERFGFAAPALGRFRGQVALRSRFNDERALDVDRASSLVELMRPLNREARSIESMGDVEEHFRDDVWFAAAAVARRSRTLWSDDAALNAVVSEFGVRAFSTLALVTALESQGSLDAESARQLRARLVAERYVRVPFDAQVYADALAVRTGAPMNVASVVEHLDGSAAEQVLSFMLANAASQATDGARLERWISAAVRWMVRISPDAESTRRNLQIIASRLVQASWLIPQTFPFVDEGLQDGLDGFDDDPLLHSIERRFRRMAVSDRRAATQWVFDLIAGVRSADRPRYTAIVLRP